MSIHIQRLAIAATTQATMSREEFILAMESIVDTPAGCHIDIFNDVRSKRGMLNIQRKKRFFVEIPEFQFF